LEVLIADSKRKSLTPFAINLKRLREAKGYSQEYLAELLDVSDRMIRKWESGTNSPRLSMVYKIVDVMEISMNSILQ